MSVIKHLKVVGIAAALVCSSAMAASAASWTDTDPDPDVVYTYTQTDNALGVFELIDFDPKISPSDATTELRVVSGLIGDATTGIDGSELFHLGKLNFEPSAYDTPVTTDGAVSMTIHQDASNTAGETTQADITFSQAVYAVYLVDGNAGGHIYYNVVSGVLQAFTSIANISITDGDGKLKAFSHVVAYGSSNDPNNSGPEPVPLPGALLLLLSGLGILGLRRKFQRTV